MDRIQSCGHMSDKGSLARFEGFASTVGKDIQSGMPLPTESDIRELLRAMTCDRPLFVLGAGASAPYVPTIATLREQVVAVLRETLPIVYGPHDRSALHDSVLPQGLRDPALDSVAVQQLLLNGLTKHSLEAIVHTALTPPALTAAPPNYAVLRRVPARAGILNYNTDGLAKRFCGDRHQVLDLHGTVDSSFTDALALRDITQMRDFLNLTQAYGSDEEFEVTPSTKFLYPVPEPPDFLGDPEDSSLGDILTKPDAVIIIGYSFGRTDRGLSDAASFEHFVSVTRGLQRPLIVVDPNGHELTGSFGEATENHNVTLVPAYWNHLSTCILEVMRRVTLEDLAASVHHVDAILRCYESRL